MLLNYILWNGGPELLAAGPVTLRWDGLLFAAGFLISQQILYYMFRKEGKPEKDVDSLTIYMVVATILGARLGHVIFYQPEIIWNDPLSIFLPFEFSPTFRFTGLQGLASHGAAFGILFALWLYARKKKPGQNYMQILDRIVILVALTGALIRFGNFFNSEILGKPTNGPLGIVFINPVTSALAGDASDKSNKITQVLVQRDDEEPTGTNGRVPIKIFLYFKPGVTQADAANYVRNTVKNTLYYFTANIDQPLVDEPAANFIKFQTIFDEKTNQVLVRVKTFGLERHPAQLYESLSCVLLFLFLFSIWNKYKAQLPEGRIFGYFMVILWSLRFVYEFLKENQVPFENNLPLNMGQILSIPLIIVGVLILIRSYRKTGSIV